MKTVNLSWICLLFGLTLCFVGILGKHYGGGGGGDRWNRFDSHRDDDSGDKGSHEDDHDDDDDEKDSFWDAVGGIVVLFFLGVIICGLFSLVSWLVCMCYKKGRKVRVRDSNVIKMSSRGSDAPMWSALLHYKMDIAGTGFGSTSKGLQRVSATQLVRSRTGASHTDGARWSTGMVSGKHVFEVTWPWGHRGTHATIGVGTAEAPIHKKGVSVLVGGCSLTWGLDIVTRRTLHNGKFISACPTDGSYVPDKFFMYVDMDNGTIGFGNDVTYWGEVIKNLPIKSSTPLYVMIGSSTPDAQISVTYKGSEGGEFATIASSYTLPPVFGPTSPQKPPPYHRSRSPNNPDRPSSANSQVINVDEYQTNDEKSRYEEPPPYCSPPPGYEPTNV